PSETPLPTVSLLVGSVRYLWISWKSASPSPSVSGSAGSKRPVAGAFPDPSPATAQPKPWPRKITSAIGQTGFFTRHLFEPFVRVGKSRISLEEIGTIVKSRGAHTLFSQCSPSRAKRHINAILTIADQ